MNIWYHVVSVIAVLLAFLFGAGAGGSIMQSEIKTLRVKYGELETRYIVMESLAKTAQSMVEHYRNKYEPETESKSE